MIRINIASIFVDDQSKALDFYTRRLGFKVKHDVPLGENRWLTLVSPADPKGTELLLEPNDHPAAKAYQAAIVADGIPATQFQVDDLDVEYEKLRSLDVTFTLEPTDAGPVRMAVLDDTCGNLIQLVQMKE